MLVLLPLSACVTQWDLQGDNPRDYYLDHPIENRVEMRQTLYTLEWRGRDRLPASAVEDLKAGLSDAEPMAAKSVEILVHPSEMNNDLRKDALSRALRRMGYARSIIKFEPSKEIRPNDAMITVTYAAVVLPHCPDWRPSPVTTYSNSTHQSNIGCASVVNLGLQVADPSDLMKGTDSQVTPDTERNAVIIRQYRSGQSSSSGSASSSGSGDSGASDTSGATSATAQ